MKPLYFRLKRVEQEENASLDHSKLLGTPVFPANFLEDKLTESDYFIAQINLEEIASYDTPLPKYGFLYFFIDVDDHTMKVLYTDQEPVEAYSDINDNFERSYFGDTTALYMEFDDSLEEGNALFSDQFENLDLESFLVDGDYTILMLLDSLTMPEGDQKPLLFASIAPYDGYYVFVMRNEDLIKNRFERVLFIDWGD